MPRKGPHRFANEIWIAPPATARSYARRALEVRKQLPPSRQAGTPAGLSRARSIARGDLQPAREIAGWFARHADNIEAAMGLTMSESKAKLAAGLWGGYAMWRAAARAVARGR